METIEQKIQEMEPLKSKTKNIELIKSLDIKIKELEENKSYQERMNLIKK